MSVEDVKILIYSLMERRLVLQNAVPINDEKVADINQVLATDKTLFVRVGRKTFFKIVK